MGIPAWVFAHRDTATKRPNEENIMATDFDNRSPNSVENSNEKKSILSTIGVWTGSLPWNGLVFFVIALMGCTGGNALAIASFNQGVENSNLNQDDKTIADYTKAIELDPKSAKAYAVRGDAYKRLKQFYKAIADYTKAIELDPKDAKAYNNRGIAYRELKKFDKAITDFTKAIDLDSKSDAYNNRGLAYFGLQQYDKAIADYTRAIELDPKAKAYNNRGNAYAQLKQFDKAITD